VVVLKKELWTGIYFTTVLFRAASRDSGHFGHVPVTDASPTPLKRNCVCRRGIADIACKMATMSSRSVIFTEENY